MVAPTGLGYASSGAADTRRSACSRSESTDGDEYVVCRPVGELDAYTVGQFREALGRAGRHRPASSSTCRDVPFMDSAGLGALIGGIRRAREAGGDVAVACSRPTLTRLLHTTGFDRIVPVTDTLDEAAPPPDAARRYRTAGG